MSVNRSAPPVDPKVDAHTRNLIACLRRRSSGFQYSDSPALCKAENALRLIPLSTLRFRVGQISRHALASGF